MSSRPKFFCAGIYAVCILLLAGFAQAAAEVEENAASTNSWLIRTWQTDEGLPDNGITGVEQAAGGQLWVGTLGGLMRFDGEHFEEFSTTHLPKVPNRVVRALHLDHQGVLWLVMDRGVLIRASDTAAKVFDASDGFNFWRVTGMTEDGEGGIWFINGNEVCRIFNDKVEHFGAAEGLPTGGNISLATDLNGQVWFACRSKVGVYRDHQWQALYTLDTGPAHLAASRSGGVWICTPTRILQFSEANGAREAGKLPERSTVQVMLEDRDGALWIGTAASGLLRLKGDVLEHVPVSQTDITALTEDREGNLWVGTDGGGLNMVRSRAMDLIGTKMGLPFESVRSICQDADGCVWAALQNGSLARGRNGQWSAVSAADGWPGGGVTCVAAAREGGVWIGTHDRGLQRLRAGKCEQWGPAEGFDALSVRSMLEASNGTLCVATDLPGRLWLFEDGKFVRLRLPHGVHAIRTLTEGTDGTIWAGTSDGQVLRVQGHMVSNEVEAQKGPPYSIRCLYATRDGSLWIGYAGSGLGRWHDGHYARITTIDGLYDNSVSQILSDGQGGLWLTGNHGLSRVRLAELADVAEGRSSHVRSTAYGRSEGLPSLQPAYENSPAAWRGRDGQLWFSTHKGMLLVQPRKIRGNPVAPPVYVNEVKLDDQPVALYDSKSPLRAAPESLLANLSAGGRLELPPRHAKIEFDFTALSFSSPENVQFRYRLKGFDTEWVEAGTTRSVSYPRLPANRYEFDVTACNEAGVWNKAGFALAFVVQPFYWQTWWFRTLLIASFTAAVIAVVRYLSFRRLRERMRLLEQQAVLDKERARIAKDLHDDLGANMTQMTLVLELALQQRSEPESVITTVQDGLVAAREAIKSLDAAVWAVNPANNTLPELVAYIGQFGMEFLQQANIRCTLDLPDQPPERPVTAELRHGLFLIVKEALNNVVRHAQAREVVLRISITAEALDLLIADDGRGIERVPDDPLADGLRNMRQRAEELNAEFKIESAPGAGTKIFLRYPWPSTD